MGTIIPILYDSAETAFTSNGLGRLSSCISCTVTEERNGIYECVFTYPVTGAHYDEIEEGMIVAVIHDDSKTLQPFDIYKRSAPIDGIVTFNAHHISYRQSLIVVNPFTASSCAQAMAKLKTEAVTTNPFTYVTDKQTAAEFKLTHPSGIRQILGGVEGSILDVFGGGEFMFDKFTTYLYQNRGTDTDVQIRYGKNLISIEKEYDISGIYNAAVPYWFNQQDNTIIMLPERIVYASGQTGDVRAVAMDLSGEFEEEPTEAQLRQTAAAKLANSKAWLPDENIKVDFVALWQTPQYESIAPLQRVRLCDTVSVYFPELGVVANRQKVIKTVYNVLLERYDSIELGEAKTSLAKMITDRAVGETRQAVTQAVSFFQRALDEATQLITGGLGGYVVFNLNADGKPQEILVMDTDDITTAVNVIRLNKNGIGFSQSGYNGPFSSSWTIDNTLNMAQINVVNLTANLVRTGLLTDELGNNYWNLTTGEFRLAATTTIGGSTVQSIANNAASAAVDGQTQTSIFNKLTNNGQTQGIYLQNGLLYINGTYIKTGAITDGAGKNYWDLTTGEFRLSSTATVGGSTVQSIANNAASAAVDGQTQTSIFNKLTNNGQTQGIYLQNGLLYINADYIKSGYISADRISGGTITGISITGSLFRSPFTYYPTSALAYGLLDIEDGKLYFKTDPDHMPISSNLAGIEYANTNWLVLEHFRSPSSQERYPGGIAFSIPGFDSDHGGNYGLYGVRFYKSYNQSVPVMHLNAALVMSPDSNKGIFWDYANTLVNSPYWAGKTNGIVAYKLTGTNNYATNVVGGLYIDGSVVSSSSSRRYKEQIDDLKDSELDPKKLLLLPVRQGKYKEKYYPYKLQHKDLEGRVFPMLIAEEVEEYYPTAAVYDNNTGEIESWDERIIVPAMLALVQEQRKEIDGLRNEVDNLKKQMELITKQIKEMRTGA